MNKTIDDSATTDSKIARNKQTDVDDSQEEDAATEGEAETQDKENEEVGPAETKSDEEDEFARCQICYSSFLTEVKRIELPCGCGICSHCFVGNVERNK